MKLEKVLVATDFSEQAKLALAEASNVAGIHGAKLIIAHVEPGAEHAPSGAQIPASALKEVQTLLDENRKYAEATLESLAATVREAGIDVSTQIEVGHADDAIVELGQRLDVDLIVTGTRGRTGFKRLLMGSTAEKVVRMSHTNVLVSRGDTSGSFKRILVPTDFSRTSEVALDVALGLAGAGGQVDLFHTWQYPGGMHGLSTPDQGTGPLGELHDSIVAYNRKRANEWTSRYARDDVNLEFIQMHGTPSHAVHDRLEEDAYDLVCMGTHGYRGLRRFMLGSVAEVTVRHATCSVLVVRAEEGAEAD